MSDINELLKINVDFLNKFPVQGSHLVDHPHELEFSRNIRRLKEIENRHNMGNSVPHFNLNIDEVIAKVRRAAAGDPEDFSRQELPLLSWHLIEVDDQLSFNYVLKLLDENWRYLFLNGLSFYVLNSWNEMDKDRRSAVCNLIREKKLKEHADFFDPAGPLRLSRLLSVRGIDLSDAPTLLGYKPSAITQSFYSDVIRTYVKDHAELLLKDVIKILLLHRYYSDGFWNYLRDHEELSLQDVIEIGQLHKYYSDEFWNYLGAHKDWSLQNSIAGYMRLKLNRTARPVLSDMFIQDRTTKLVLSDLVIRTDEENDNAVQLELRDTIKHVLGDITLNATWAPFIGATEDDKRLLKHARELVNKWLARDFIKAFFEVCVQDYRRKAYWLKFVNYVDGFRVVGSDLVNSRLKESPETKEYVDRFFISINSKSDDKAALVMRIRNKMFIEFSDKGHALYIYNDNDNWVAYLMSGTKHISALKDLKNTKLPSISDRHLGYVPDEGRHVHKDHKDGSWEDYIDVWMKWFFERNSMEWPPKED